MSQRQTKINISDEAAAELARFQAELKDREAFTHRASASIAIEYLIWHFEQTRGGSHLGKFSPKTRPQGRPMVPYPQSRFPSERAARPNEVRKLLAKEAQRVDQITAARKVADRDYPRRHYRPRTKPAEPDGRGPEGQ